MVHGFAGFDRLLSRRTLLRGTGLAAALGLIGSRTEAEDVFAPDTADLCTTSLGRSQVAELTSVQALKLAWNANAVCLSPVAVALKKGFFTSHNLDVELVNFAGATDQLLQIIATGKADAGVGMALRWLKPLEQGFDVKLTAGIHGGCLRLLGSKAAGITSLDSLRGKTIAVTDMGSAGKNFFAVLLAKRGIDPVRDVEWRQYPGDLLAAAIEKGEAQALADSDPLTWGFLKSGKLAELATNLSAEYAHRTCCLIGVRGSLLQEARPVAAALTRALIEAQDWTLANPEQAAAAFVEFTPKYSVDDLAAMLKSHAHGNHPVGDEFRRQLVQYAEELRSVSVLKTTTDPVKFAERITVDVI